MKPPNLFALGCLVMFLLPCCAGKSTNRPVEEASVGVTDPAKPAYVESPEQFHQRTSVDFVWKNNDLVELAPGVTFNIHNGSLFYQGRTQIEELNLLSGDDCPVAEECTDAEDRLETGIAPNGAMIWLTLGDGFFEKLQICVWKPALANCSEELPAQTECYALHDVIRHHPPKAVVHSAATEADPLFQALQETETVYLPDRGLTSDGGDGDECFAWQVDSDDSSDSVRLSRKELQGEARVEPARKIRFFQGYTWSWSKGSQAGSVDLDNVEVPSAAEKRECHEPTDDDGWWSTSSTASYCNVPLGDFLRADAKSIELGKTTLYKTLAACERSRRAQLLSRIPSCKSR